MSINIQVLTLKHYGITSDDDMEVTISPAMVKMVAAKDSTIQDRPVKKTTVKFLDSDSEEINISELDLLQLQSIVGGYGFMEG